MAFIYKRLRSPLVCSPPRSMVSEDPAEDECAINLCNRCWRLLFSSLPNPDPNYYDYVNQIRRIWYLHNCVLSYQWCMSALQQFCMESECTFVLITPLRIATSESHMLSCHLRGISTARDLSFLDFLSSFFRITVNINLIISFLLSDSVALIGQSIHVHHSCIISHK
jgi:hypothetical protein